MPESRLLLSLILCLLATHLHGALRVTEVMSSSSSGTPDWFEVTNYGAVTIVLDSNWRMDDDSANFANSVPFGSTLNISPGETVVLLETSSALVRDNFISLWGLTGQVGTYTGSQVSLSSGGDGVNLFENGGLSTGVSFGAATPGRSFYWTYSSDTGLPISGPLGGTVSQSGVFGAYAAGADIASPGVALPTTSSTTVNWIGGTETWTATGGTNWDGGAWNGEKTAVFALTGGTVTVTDDVSALGLDFRVDAYVLDGAGSVETSQISVANAGDTARVNVVLTGTGGLAKFGLGTLELGAENSYDGTTSVSQGTLRFLVDNALSDGSVVSVGLGGLLDLNDRSDTVGGLAGLGTVNLGSGHLTVSIAGPENQEFNGGLHGSGDFIVDSAGDGDQIFDTRVATEGVLKDYTGRTIIRNGTLRVNASAVPVATSGVLIEGGKLRLTTDGAEYTFGGDAATEVVLAGGAIRQDNGESITLHNAIRVDADSTIESRVDTEDPFSAPNVALTGSLSGSGGLAISGGGRVSVETGGTYSGTIGVSASNLHVNGTLHSGSIILEAGSTLSGSGSVGSVSGGGKIAPGNSPGIQTFGSVDPTGGLDFAFEFTAAAPNYADALFSDNDVLRITGANPLEPGLSGGNTVEIFLSFASLTEGDFFLGGFFLDQQANFDSLVAGADYLFYVTGDGGGTDAFVDGFGYYALGNYDPTLGIAVSTVAATVDFGGGAINGSIMQLTVVPEPGSFTLSVCGLLFLSQAMRRRSSRRTLSS